MVENKCMRGSLNPDNLLETYQYKKEFAREHPEYFKPDGIVVFTGMQGSGKTLSAVAYIHKLCLQYPKAIVVSNCALTFPDCENQVLEYKGYKQIKEMDNGYAGIILFLDEIQSEFNSLESKDIDPAWFQVISMQRKRRLHVVGTSQLFSRVAKCWREQFHNVVECRCLFGYIQMNAMVDCVNAKEVDGQLVYETSKPFFWFHKPELYTFYDTWERVKKVENVKGDKQNDSRRCRTDLRANCNTSVASGSSVRIM